MPPRDPRDTLLTRGMIAVLVAQFVSALADNALLFAAIALLRAQMAAPWHVPLLQEFFVLAFILLAPFVGPFADGLPKGRVMLLANGMKLGGAAAMLFGLHPLLAYGAVGIGAAAYSPAKYGILSELVTSARLVKANSLMEGSTIVAILLGAVIGGILAERALTAALIGIVLAYALALLVTLLIPRLPPAHPRERFDCALLLRDFAHAARILWRDTDARFSLLGTSIFWGTGATLRFLLVAWVPFALPGGDLSLAANLSGVVAIGIALGAAAAAKWVTLQTVRRVLPAGVLIGALLMAFAPLRQLYPAVALLVLIGACGGFYVVPLNAMLQDRGHASVGSGHAIAVQNLLENVSMLLLIGIYTAMEKSGVPVVSSTLMIGLLVLSAIGTLGYRRHRHEKAARL